MNRLVLLGIVLAVIIIVAAVAYYVYNYYTSGNLNIYVQDPPVTSTLKIYLTISSIMIHKANSTSNSTAWITISNRTMTVLLTYDMTFLASAKLPPGEYNEIFIQVSSVEASIGTVNVSVILPSSVFKIHIVGGVFLSGGSSESLLITIPHTISANGTIMISPSVTAKVIT